MMWDAVFEAFRLVFDPYVLVVIVLSAVFGIFVGAMPGLTATMATALLVPVTFFMPPVPALGAIVTATAMAIFAGDIPAAMLRIPGTPASAAYTDESYEMSKKGLLDLNLGVNLVFSVIGGLFGVAILIVAAPLLAEVAINFSSFEYFWLAALGLTCAVFIATDSPLKGFASLLVGLAIGCIGIDPAAGYPRFTFGSVELLQGISFIPAMIGLFAVSELLRGAVTVDQAGQVRRRRSATSSRASGRVEEVPAQLPARRPRHRDRCAAWRRRRHRRLDVLRDQQALLQGAREIRHRPRRGHRRFGAANNSALAGAWIPALVFGIPGDSITAIVIGVLYMKNMNPGPTLFTQNPQNIYAVYLLFILANLIMMPLGWLCIKVGQADPARAAQHPDAGDPAVLHRRRLRDQQHAVRHRRDAGRGRRRATSSRRTASRSRPRFSASCSAACSRRTSSRR